MIRGQRIRLRAIEREDLPMIAAWRNDPEVYRYFFEYEPLSLARQERWFEAFLNKDDEKYWIAETVEPQAAVGTIALCGIDWRSRKAELGRVLVFPEKYRGQGYSREMCRLALDFAFDQLNLNRIWLRVFADNAAAINLYRKLGFQQEGLMRQHTFAAGDYRDVALMSLLRGERPESE